MAQLEVPSVLVHHATGYYDRKKLAGDRAVEPRIGRGQARASAVSRTN